MIDSDGGSGGLYLGIEIGGTKLQVFVGDEKAGVLERHRFQVEPSQGGAGIRTQLEKIIPTLAAMSALKRLESGLAGRWIGRQAAFAVRTRSKGGRSFRWPHG